MSTKHSSLAVLFPLSLLFTSPGLVDAWSASNMDDIKPGGMYAKYCQICGTSAADMLCMCSGNLLNGNTGDYTDLSAHWNTQPGDKTCQFAPYPGQTITIGKDSLDNAIFGIQAGSGNCENDYLEIDGVKYCDTDNPFPAAGITNPTGNAESIKFVTNGDTTYGSGWRVRLAALNCALACTPHCSLLPIMISSPPRPVPVSSSADLPAGDATLRAPLARAPRRAMREHVQRHHR